MAFALTQFKMYGSEMSEGVSPNCVQYLEFDCTGLNTDVAYDFATLTPGTFWTAVNAHATYGTVGTQCFKNLKQMINSGVALKDFVIPEVTWAKLRAAATGAGVYTLAYTAASLCNDIAIHAADAPTAFKVIIGMIMKPEYTVKTGTYDVNGWVGKV
jgi:hypothetical protein